MKILYHQAKPNIEFKIGDKIFGNEVLQISKCPYTRTCTGMPLAQVVFQGARPSCNRLRYVTHSVSYCGYVTKKLVDYQETLRR